MAMNTPRRSASTTSSKRSKPKVRQRRTPAGARLAVQLATRRMDGQAADGGKVALIGPIRRPRRCEPEASASIQGRESAARKIARGIRPENVARLLEAMAHPQRIRILLKLLGGEATHKLLAKATGLKAGPLYHHLRELRMAELIGPKVRDLYTLTPTGGRAILAALAMERLCR